MIIANWKLPVQTKQFYEVVHDRIILSRTVCFTAGCHITRWTVKAVCLTMYCYKRWSEITRNRKFTIQYVAACSGFFGCHHQAELKHSTGLPRLLYICIYTWLQKHAFGRPARDSDENPRIPEQANDVVCSNSMLIANIQWFVKSRCLTFVETNPTQMYSKLIQRNLN